MENKKLEQLQKMYEDGLITEDELKTKRKKIISEIIDCYKQNKDSKMGIKTRIIPRKSVEKYLNFA